MARSQQHIDGRREGIKFAIEWLHKHANEKTHPKTGPRAKLILDCAADGLGRAAKEAFLEAEEPSLGIPSQEERDA